MTLDEMIAALRRRERHPTDELLDAFLAELERRRPVCEREGHQFVATGRCGHVFILCERCGIAPKETP